MGKTFYGNGIAKKIKKMLYSPNGNAVKVVKIMYGNKNGIAEEVWKYAIEVNCLCTLDKQGYATPENVFSTSYTDNDEGLTISGSVKSPYTADLVITVDILDGCPEPFTLRVNSYNPASVQTTSCGGWYKLSDNSSHPFYFSKGTIEIPAGCIELALQIKQSVEYQSLNVTMINPEGYYFKV